MSKKYISIVLTILMFTCFSCKQNSQPIETTVQQNSGRVIFTFDKINTPSDVKTLTTVLSRSGFPSKQRIINIQQDTGAVILFDQVEIGTWSIQVDAKNDSGKVIYTGKSEVLVYENFVSQVNLVLTKVSLGIGSVQINVKWEEGNFIWKDYINNPILTKTGKNIDWGGVGQPKVFFDNGIYRMYYLNFSFPSPVSYAESQDGIHWYRYDSIPILTIGSKGSWDDGGVGPGPVYKIGDIYYMLYQGYDAINKHFRVGLAKSTNARQWSKSLNPILSDSLSWEGNMVASDVEIINNKYYLYYCTNGKIGLAVSGDGLNWIRYSANPILIPTKNWEYGNITFPSVVKIGNKLVMIYMNNGSYSDIAFGMADSYDGIAWNKNSANPFFKYQQTNNTWASKGVVYPYATNIQNTVRIYYTGVCENDEWKIGFMYN